MDMTGMDTTRYFATAVERQSIKMRRDAGLQPPWTKDEVFQKYRFCNVHREDDKTTQWFRNEVRSKLAGLRVVEATVIFRWMNRIETGEIIKDLLLNGWNRDEAKRRLQDVRPLVTGAYMIKTRTGMSKLDGMLAAIDDALPQLPVMVAKWGSSIEAATEDLLAIDGLGRFLAYEITTDLRWTPVLNQAADILTWANAGPGCTHGLGRLFDDPWKWKRGDKIHQQEMVDVMQELVRQSQDPMRWPANWTAWEMRTAEHWSCEYDKHCRGLAGERLKRRFRLE